MDARTASIVSALFVIIVAELPEETRQRILLQLECASKSPLVRECDRDFYKTVHGTLTRPTSELADELIEDLPLSRQDRGVESITAESHHKMRANPGHHRR
jgi:hypothetical protein